MLLAFWMLALLGRVLAGAPDSSFGAFEDEPAHLVTGLMVRDFLAAGDFSQPQEFAREYYANYPKVAFGQWPPLVHGVLAVWTWLFGDSRLALILLTTLVAALGAQVTRALALGTGMPRPVPLLAGVLYLGLPLVQEYAGLIMTEGPLSLCCGLAVLGFARLLERDDNWGCFLFMVGSISALMIKGLAFALALLPALAIPIAWRWDRLRSRRLWLAAATIGMVAAPWYVSFYEESTGTWSGGTSPSLGYAWYAFSYYPLALVRLGGPGVLALALIGFLVGLRDLRVRTRWAVYLAWTPSLLALLVTIPSSVEARHVIITAPVLAAAAVSGAWFLAVRFFPSRPGLGCAVLTVVGFLPMGFEFPTKEYHGFEEVALRCLFDAELERGPFLVASDAAGEGMLVSEFLLASDGEQPVQVLRASKLLGTGDWLGRGYQPRFETVAELEAYLTSLPVAAIAIDRTAKEKHWFEHFDQLLQMVEENPERWRVVAHIDVQRNGRLEPGAMLLVEMVGHGDLPRTEVTFDMARGSHLR